MNTNTKFDFTDTLSNMITTTNPNTPTTKPITKKKTNKTTKKSNTQKPKKNTQKTNINTQPTKPNNKTKPLTNPKNPNSLSKKEAQQVSQVSNQPQIKIKSKAQADKDFTKAQRLSNNDKRVSLFLNVLDNINNEKQENNKPILTLQRFTSMTNSLMKIFNDSKYLIQDDDTIYSLLTDKMDMILDTIKDKSINTQRKIITDIITILNSNDNTQLKDIKKYEYYRKSIQLNQKSKNSN